MTYREETIWRNRSELSRLKTGFRLLTLIRDFAFLTCEVTHAQQTENECSSAFAYPRVSKSAKIFVEYAKFEGEGLFGGCFFVKNV